MANEPKEVRSDLKDVTPEGVDEQRAKAAPRSHDHTRDGARSDHQTHAIPQGDNELRGGRDRDERKGGGSVGHVRGTPRHGTHH